MKSRREIERALVDSLLKGNAVGIRLKNSTEVIVTTAVDFDTSEIDNRWIEIKPFTLYGYCVE